VKGFHAAVLACHITLHWVKF